MRNRWIPVEPVDVRLSEVEEGANGSIPIPGRFLSCSLPIKGRGGRRVEVRANTLPMGGSPFDIASDKHLIAIRGMHLGRFGNDVPRFDVRDAG